MRAWCHWLIFILSFHGSSGHRFDLRLEFRWNLVDVFGTDKDTGPLVCLALKTGLSALTDARCHDLSHVLREQRYVVADTDQKSGSTRMIT